MNEQQTLNDDKITNGKVKNKDEQIVLLKSSEKKNNLPNTSMVGA